VVVVSLKVALCATAAVMCCSLLLANILAFSRSKLLKALEIAIYLPMAMPPVALGYGLLLIFGHDAWLGVLLHRLGIEVAFNFLGAVLAAFLVSLGIGVRTLRQALSEIDAEQRQVAKLLGARPWQIYLFIELPQCKGAIISATVLVFIRALSEFGATIVLAGNSLGSTRTLALAIWVGMETPGRERECLVFLLIAALVSVVAITLSEMALKTRRPRR